MGDTVNVQQFSGSWARIGTNRWVTTDFIARRIIVSGTRSVNVGAGNTLNIRRGPTTTANVVGSLTNGTRVTITHRANGFYRIGYAEQMFTHNYWIGRLGEDEARRSSARPGHSEHQLGLALDVSTHALGGVPSPSFSSSPEGLWVGQNAHRFGFIIRYPQGRELDTGFIYEPWHIRYVGVQVATEIFNNGFILEEFLQ